MNKSTIVGIIVIIFLVLVLIFVPVEFTRATSNSDSNEATEYLRYTTFCNKNDADCLTDVDQIQGPGKTEVINQEQRTCGKGTDFVCDYEVDYETDLPQGSCYDLVDQEKDTGRYEMVAQQKLGCEYKRTPRCPPRVQDFKGDGRDYTVSQERLKDPCF